MDDAVGPGVSSCEYGSQALVRRIPAGVTVRKLDSTLGHAVDVGACRRFSAVTAEVSGSERIDDDEDDVGMFFFFIFHAGSFRPGKVSYYGIGEKTNQTPYWLGWVIRIASLRWKKNIELT